jgi:hypothetical protein
VGRFPLEEILLADVGPAVARIVILTEATMRKVVRWKSKRVLFLVGQVEYYIILLRKVVRWKSNHCFIVENK